MNFRYALKIISSLLAVSLLVGLFGCGTKDSFLSDRTSDITLVESFSEDEISDNAEEDIKNNKGKILFSSPRKEKLTVHDSVISFNGLCNDDYPLLMNGQKQSIGDGGYFTVNYELELGNNKITFKNGEFSKTFSIKYTRPLIKSYTPSDSKLTLDGGMPLSITAVVKADAKVTAEYNGQTHDLSPTDQKGDGYVTYKCIVTTAKKGSHLIRITASLNGDSQTVKASKIISTNQSGINYNHATVKSLQNKGYVDVGETYVAQVVSATAEGFLGGTVDDCSRPTVNYLPYGTMDYCSPSKIYDSESGKKYYLLRNNMRVYARKKNVKLVKGTLPETNSIEYSGGGISDKHLLLNFKVNWRAPFRFLLGGQGYKDEGAQDYTISSPTFSYVDITFCYSEDIKNFYLPENPIFSRFEVIKNSKDYTLRLHLKTAGKFWGWKARYTDSQTLQFSFLCPSVIQKADNPYGYSLQGIKITVDAGHGGSDSGTYNAANSPYYEKFYNLNYAKMLASKLHQLGATVYMTRSEDKTMSLESRYSYITATNADLAISVHFNGSTNGNVNGFFMGYFNPYTYDAAKTISQSVASTGLMSPEKGGTDWHYFNLSRVSACPVVLTENGYLTGIEDYKKIKTLEHCQGYVDGIVRGVINYFAKESGYAVDYSYTPTQSTVVSASSVTSSMAPSSSIATKPNITPSRIVITSTPSRIIVSSSVGVASNASSGQQITISSSVPSRIVDPTSSVHSRVTTSSTQSATASRPASTSTDTESSPAQSKSSDTSAAPSNINSSTFNEAK